MMNGSVNCFNKVLFRIGGTSFDLIKEHHKNYNDLNLQLDKMYIADAEKAGVIKSIADDLQKLIPDVNDDAVRKKLINFKRDFYNERKAALSGFFLLNHYMPAGLKAAIEKKFELDRQLTLAKESIII